MCLVAWPLDEGETGVDVVVIAPCFSYANDAVLMLISTNLHDKSSEVSIKTRSTPASLSFNGQATKHTTIKWSIRNIGRIRNYLDQPSTERLVHAFVLSKLDYCNSVLYGLPAKQLSNLQRLQTSAARLVTKAKRTNHITPVLRQLYWLPVNQTIVSKVLLITFKIINGYAPSYLSSLLESYKPKRTLPSATKRLLIVPISSTSTYGDRTFSHFQLLRLSFGITYQIR